MVPTKTAIIVSGMHRCGTSAIAGVLHLLGASLPRKLMPAMPENPRGFFESLDVKALNDRIFADAGREWCDRRSDDRRAARVGTGRRAHEHDRPDGGRRRSRG